MSNILFPLYTNNLTLKESCLKDLKKLSSLYVEFCKYMEPFTGNTSWAIDDVKKQLLEGDLPPGGVKERYQHVSIFDSKTQALIGFMEIYNGYPKDNIYYISSLYINFEYQNKGLGKETVLAVCNNISNILRVSVDLKNWAALKFWFLLGFCKITKLKGDNYMKMELERIN